MTKDELKEIIAKTHEGDMNTLKKKLINIVDFIDDQVAAVKAVTFKVGGTGTAAQIAALEDVEAGAVYRVITTGGDLNSGGDAITVAVRDLVYWDGTKWVLFVDADGA